MDPVGSGTELFAGGGGSSLWVSIGNSKIVQDQNKIPKLFGDFHKL